MLPSFRRMRRSKTSSFDALSENDGEIDALLDGSKIVVVIGTDGVSCEMFFLDLDIILL